MAFDGSTLAKGKAWKTAQSNSEVQEGNELLAYKPFQNEVM